MPSYVPQLIHKPKLYNGPPISQFTEGDLHANTIRLLECLMHYGIIEVDDDKYQLILQAYQRSLNYPQLKDNNEILSHLLNKYVIVKNKKMLVRLIGDTVADRTGNDLFTLTVISKLVEAGANLRILISNHDINFMTSVLGATDLQELKTRMNHNLLFFTQHEQGISFLRLVESVERGEITFEELQTLSRNYFSTLILLDYAVGQDGKLKIFSHAPINLTILNDLGIQFGVPYPGDDASDAQRIAFVNAINANFRSYVQMGKSELIADIFDETGKGTPASQVIWTRELGHTFIPAEKNLINVYGHDKQLKDEELKHTHVIRLDNKQGKGSLDTTNEPTSWATNDSISAIPKPSAPITAQEHKKRLKQSFLALNETEIWNQVNVIRKVLERWDDHIDPERKQWNKLKARLDVLSALQAADVLNVDTAVEKYFSASCGGVVFPKSPEPHASAKPSTEMKTKLHKLKPQEQALNSPLKKPIKPIISSSNTMSVRPQESQKKARMLKDVEISVNGILQELNRVSPDITYTPRRSVEKPMIQILQKKQEVVMEVSPDAVSIYKPLLKSAKISLASKAQLILQALGIPPALGQKLEFEGGSRVLRNEVRALFREYKQQEKLHSTRYR